MLFENPVCICGPDILISPSHTENLFRAVFFFPLIAQDYYATVVSSCYVALWDIFLYFDE